jgi:hypothetical protein
MIITTLTLALSRLRERGFVGFFSPLAKKVYDVFFIQERTQKV